MLDFFLVNWRQKLISLIVAAIVWAFFKEKVDPGTFDQILHGPAIQAK